MDTLRMLDGRWISKDKKLSVNFHSFSEHDSWGFMFVEDEAGKYEREFKLEGSTIVSRLKGKENEMRIKVMEVSYSALKLQIDNKSLTLEKVL